MKRLTLDNTFEMNVHELALNQVYIGEDRWVRYRNGPEDDLSVCDLIRTAAGALDVELPILSDEDLSDLMTDWLQYGAEEPEGVLAILYRALCAMAEVRAKLSRYEDTGLGPDEIATEPYGCVFYCNRKCNLDGDWCAEGPGCQQELNSGTAKRLLKLAQAEKDGRLVVPPCKVGDLVFVDVRTLPYNYLHPADGCDDYAKCEVVSIVTTKRETYMKLRALYPSRDRRREHLRYGVSAIGKTVFLARKEAEAALKKREGGEEL